MTIHLPQDLERYVLSQVESGRFASADEAIALGVRLLRQGENEPAKRVEPLTEEAWERQLMETGLLRSIPSKHHTSPPRLFQPIRIEGEPLSETVIRERR